MSPLQQAPARPTRPVFGRRGLEPTGAGADPGPGHLRPRTPTRRPSPVPRVSGHTAGKFYRPDPHGTVAVPTVEAALDVRGQGRPGSKESSGPRRDTKPRTQTVSSSENGKSVSTTTQSPAFLRETGGFGVGEGSGNRPNWEWTRRPIVSGTCRHLEWREGRRGDDHSDVQVGAQGDVSRVLLGPPHPPLTPDRDALLHETTVCWTGPTSPETPDSS